MIEQQDMFGAKVARDDALKRVADNAGDWMQRALVAITLLRGEWTGEDIRLSVSKVVGDPHHHNAWGSLIKAAISGHIIKPTGKYRAMRTVKSHARRTPVYFICS
jgi:hypothetical protein